MHYMNFNGIFQAVRRPLFKAYGIGGFGMYYRSVSLTTPDVGFTTYCDPYWYVCYPTLSRSTGSSAIARPGIPASTSAAA